MATRILQTLNDGTVAYRFGVTLDGAPFGFDFHFNEVAGVWFFDLYDGAGALLVGSVRVTTGVDLLAQYVNDQLPVGKLLVLDADGESRDAGLTDLGKSLLLLYAEAP